MILKSCWPSAEDGKWEVSLRLGYYGSALSDIQDLLTEAQFDFPQLTAGDVRVVKYQSPKYCGIEFVTSRTPPNNYRRQSTFDLVF